MSESKRHLVVLFGGQSAEHEVSVTSARSMLGEINRERYDITLVGITDVEEVSIVARWDETELPVDPVEPTEPETVESCGEGAERLFTQLD